MPKQKVNAKGLSKEERSAAKQPVVIKVVAHYCTMTFTPWVSTGPDTETQPGVGIDFTFAPEYPSELNLGGVIRRDDIKRLRDMCDLFLKHHAKGLRL
jgi:hypothetical protein